MDPSWDTHSNDPLLHQTLTIFNMQLPGTTGPSVQASSAARMTQKPGASLGISRYSNPKKDAEKAQFISIEPWDFANFIFFGNIEIEYDILEDGDLKIVLNGIWK